MYSQDRPSSGPNTHKQQRDAIRDKHSKSILFSFHWYSVAFPSHSLFFPLQLS